MNEHPASHHLVFALVPTAAELTGIEVACSLHERHWACDNADFVQYKQRLREVHGAVQNWHCCYCRTDLDQHGNVDVDREHILPKSKYPLLFLHPTNLSVACRTCNFSYKGQKDDFYKPNPATADAWLQAESYTIIHPNLDLYEGHIWTEARQSGSNTVRTQVVLNNSKKGQMTFDIFSLKDRSRRQLDGGQGLQLEGTTDDTQLLQRLAEHSPEVAALIDRLRAEPDARSS